MIFAASLVASLVGAVVVGVGDVDGDATVVGVADGALQARCTVPHGRGMVPKGAVVDDDRVVLAVADDKGGRGGRGARVVLLDLRTCVERELFDEAIANQAPRVVTDAAGRTVVYAVREIDPQPAGGRFEVVKADVDAGAPVVVTARDALWVSIAQGAERERDLVFLVGESAQSGGSERDGEFHVDVIDAAANLAVLHPLGRGTFKDAVVVDGDVVVEEVRGAVRGVRVFEKGADRFVPLGMAAAPYGARGHLYTSNGKKDGGILASGVALPAARVGIARPVAVAVDAAVVVDVDRGALLPRELWTLPLWRSPREPMRLLVPKARTAVEVYGVTSSSAATPKTPPPSTQPQTPGAARPTGVR